MGDVQSSVMAIYDLLFTTILKHIPIPQKRLLLAGIDSINMMARIVKNKILFLSVHKSLLGPYIPPGVGFKKSAGNTTRKPVE